MGPGVCGGWSLYIGPFFEFNANLQEQEYLDGLSSEIYRHGVVPGWSSVVLRNQEKIS